MTRLKTYTLQKPYARSLYEQIREDILTRTLQPHEKLPSRRELASSCGVSVITVQNALDQLEAEGLIEARPRSGCFVQPLPSYRSEDETPFEFHELPEETEFPDRADEFPSSLWYRTLRQVISQEGDRLLVRSPNRGCARLRNAIARYLVETRQMKVQPEQVIVSSGAESLYQIILKMFGSDLSIAIEDPGYHQIETIYREHRVQIHKLPMKQDGIDPERLFSCHADLLHVTPFLSWPTKITASSSRRHDYLKWAYENEAYILEDDFNSEFFQSGPMLPTLYSLDHNSRVIYMNTFSKSLSPSLRLGYMVLPEELLDLYEKKAGMYTNTVPLLEQYTLAEFIANGSFERLLFRKRKKIRESERGSENSEKQEKKRNG